MSRRYLSIAGVRLVVDVRRCFLSPGPGRCCAGCPDLYDVRLRGMKRSKILRKAQHLAHRSAGSRADLCLSRSEGKKEEVKSQTRSPILGASRLRDPAIRRSALPSQAPSQRPACQSTTCLSSRTSGRRPPAHHAACPAPCISPLRGLCRGRLIRALLVDWCAFEAVLAASRTLDGLHSGL